MNTIDASLATLQPAPVFPELYQELWVYSGATCSTSTPTTAGGIFLGKGASGGVASSSNTATHLYTLNSSWSASLKYALEVTLYTSSSGGTAYAQLWDFTSASAVGPTVSTTSTTATVIRSSQTTLTPGHVYGVTWWTSSTSYSAYITDASLIVFPSSPLVSPSVSSISLAGGSSLKESYYPLFVYSSAYESTSVTSSGSSFLQKGMSGGWATSDTVSAAKLYTLTSSWSSSQKFVLEASFMSNNASYTAYAALWDTNTHTLVSSSQLSTTATTMTLFRSSQFTLTPGHSYAVTCWISNSSGLAQISKCHLVALA